MIANRPNRPGSTPKNSMSTAAPTRAKPHWVFGKLTSVQSLIELT